jgi:hypothetical protein
MVGGRRRLKSTQEGKSFVLISLYHYPNLKETAGRLNDILNEKVIS